MRRRRLEGVPALVGLLVHHNRHVHVGVLRQQVRLVGQARGVVQPPEVRVRPLGRDHAALIGPVAHQGRGQRGGEQQLCDAGPTHARCHAGALGPQRRPVAKNAHHHRGHREGVDHRAEAAGNADDRGDVREAVADADRHQHEQGGLDAAAQGGALEQSCHLLWQQLVHLVARRVHVHRDGHHQGGPHHCLRDERSAVARRVDEQDVFRRRPAVREEAARPHQAVQERQVGGRPQDHLVDAVRPRHVELLVDRHRHVVDRHRVQQDGPRLRHHPEASLAEPHHFELLAQLALRGGWRRRREPSRGDKDDDVEESQGRHWRDVAQRRDVAQGAEGVDEQNRNELRRQHREKLRRQHTRQHPREEIQVLTHAQHHHKVCDVAHEQARGWPKHRCDTCGVGAAARQVRDRDDEAERLRDGERAEEDEQQAERHAHHSKHVGQQKCARPDRGRHEHEDGAP
mmetsp:Transcript_8756/g.23448  ORF Transcript_8756/g.23448 Transcript_8756/m.23448 type:complete len:457 (+) Transcript_8756:309-1679(+)